MNRHEWLRRSGFTLIEMAIVSVIIGVMAWGLMSFMDDYIAREKLEEARRDADYVAQEVEGYILGNSGKLPEPRTGNLIPSSIGNSRDPWGNEYRYWRADALNGTAVDNVETTDLFIRYYDSESDLPAEGTAATVNATRTINNVAYVVISLGKDQTRHFTTSPGSVYINLLEDGAKIGGDNFDDIVQYKTLEQVRTTFATTGQEGRDQVSSPSGDEAAISVKGGVAGGLEDMLSNPDYVASGADVGVVSNTGVGSGQAISLGGAADSPTDPENRIDLTSVSEDYAFETYTIMCWFKTDPDYDPTDSDAFGVLTARSNNASARTWWLTIWGGGYSQNRSAGENPNPRDTLSGDLALKTGNGFIIFTHDTPQVRYDDDQWHFVAATVRPSGSDYEAELFVDGEVKDTHVRSSHPPTGDYEFYIGSGSDGYSDNRRYQGLIDEFYIYGSLTEDKSLTTAEILDYYNKSKASFGK